MLKVIGAAIVIAAAGTIGVMYITELRRRSRDVKAFIDALPALRREICDMLTPTIDAIVSSEIKFEPLIDIDEVRQLRRLLGKVGAEEQRIAITRTEAWMTAMYEKLERERKSKGKVFAATCLSAGLMLAIVLI
ncbi:MAG: stage III sporulation protein AB [Oscillospiraceae bacterium]|jgi:hypothetical protein|nr:stage III sporulation protein AB [Oscillospiraceae bacterium]